MKRGLALPGMLFLSVIFITSAFAAMRQATPPAGGISGIATGGGVSAFLGIPYAAPPVGDLRWRPPQAAAPWSDVLEATHFSPSCIQRDQTGGFGPWTTEYVIPGPVSEDCLYLNVWTPAETSEDRLPVFFWIHGGGFDSGSGSVPLYEGTRLAAQGIVVVNVNYRVNVFGFLAHPELMEESPHHSAGNYGLLDIVAALRWVRDNISAFGGNPKQVTIAGQSAGAAAVQYLMSSPLAKGLFSQAIIESGPGSALPSRASLEGAEQAGVDYVKARGASSIEALRRLPVEAFGIRPADAAASSVRFGPVVDGWFLPKTSAEQAGQPDIPVLAGVVAEEASFLPDYGNVDVARFKELARQRFGSLADEFLSLYPVDRDEDALSVLKRSTRDRYRVALYEWARERNQAVRSKTFIYLWNHVEPGPNAQLYGSFHSSELPYVFDNLDVSDRPFTEADRRIAAMMSAYWVHFVKTGDPNSGGRPPWPATDPDQTTIMELGDSFGAGPVADAARLEFFHRYLSSPEARNRGWMF
ncbi:MAG: carboxylesterase family protein [Acidobacteriota bacterium]